MRRERFLIIIIIIIIVKEKYQKIRREFSEFIIIKKVFFLMRGKIK